MRNVPWKIKLTIALGFSVYLGACVALRSVKRDDESGRGFIFDHPVHVEQGLDCTLCHNLVTADPVRLDHEFCGVCHDIDEGAPDPTSCGNCHTEPDYAVKPRVPILSKELTFSHAPHMDAGLDCTACHGDPDTSPLPKGPLMQVCMDCHEQTSSKLNACEVCHTEITVDTVPTSRNGIRLPHDAPEIWRLVHGRESMTDKAFCAMCHEDESACSTCHRQTKPMDHTVAWRRKPHGLKASWDRGRCDVCHEEDSCVQCHNRTEPTSHRGAFGVPQNNHCYQCHFPENNTSCAVCHESVEHEYASPSPHEAGIFPSDCAQCHPSGNPFRAPHAMNSTSRCVYCHN